LTILLDDDRSNEGERLCVTTIRFEQVTRKLFEAVVIRTADSSGTLIVC
jgi:hypothetical protein